MNAHVQDNRAATLPIFHVFKHSKDRPVFSNITQHEYQYKKTLATFTPKDGPPDEFKSKTKVRCNICGQDIPVEVTQVTALRILNSELSIRGGKHKLFKIFSAIIYRGALPKTLICLFGASFLVLSSPWLPSNGRFKADSGWWDMMLFCISAIGTAVGCYLFYVTTRLLTCRQIVLIIRKKGDYGYGDPTCFNFVLYAKLTGEDDHLTVLAEHDGNKTFSMKNLLSSYGFCSNTWIIL